MPATPPIIKPAFRVPRIPQFSVFFRRLEMGFGVRTGLLVNFNKRFVAPFFGGSEYTYAHSIETAESELRADSEDSKAEFPGGASQTLRTTSGTACCNDISRAAENKYLRDFTFSTIIRFQSAAVSSRSTRGLTRMAMCSETTTGWVRSRAIRPRDRACKIDIRLERTFTIRERFKAAAECDFH